jgi:hypothetical protein
MPPNSTAQRFPLAFSLRLGAALYVVSSLGLVLILAGTLPTWGLILAAANFVLSLYWLADALTARTELQDDRLVIVSTFRRREYRRGEIVDVERLSSFASEHVVLRRADGGEDRSQNVDSAAELADAIRQWVRVQACC